MKRLTKHTQSINSSSPELIAENEYDELGQLIGKGVGNLASSSSRLQDIDYSYNIRGWLKEINDADNTNKLFNFKLSYNDPVSGTPLFNGNISRVDWRTDNTDSGLKYYQYYYDDLNRITSATANSTNYNVSGISYDKNGNITNLTRRGVINSTSTSFGNMDVLTYGYDSNSNKLKAVNDSGNTTYGFKDASSLTTQYTYDLNGNMTKDENKDITAITYNHLNLPDSITLPGGTISYIYDATGVKQRKVAAGTTTDYAGNYLYQGGILQFFNHPEGYVENDNGIFKYHYQYKDHLGNIRLSYTNSGSAGSPNVVISEENNYYPFGLRHKGYNDLGNGYGNSAAKKYKFGGKELQEEHNLEWYDVSARNYDPALGRWMNIDPLAESMPEWSPYNFAFNNPIRYVDPLGLAPEDWVKKGDQWMWDENITSAEQATAAGYDDYRAPGSIIDNATINGESGSNGKSSVYLGQNANDVSHTYPNSTVTPFQVGTEWLSGEGSRNRDFTNGDYFTELLKQHDHVNSTVGSITNELTNGGGVGLSGSEPYSLGGVQGVGKYVKDYSTLATAGQTGNLAVTYLGSYSLNWSVTGMSNGSATIQFRVSNSSTMQSASRPPVLGYLPIWQNTAGNAINNYFSTGWGSKTTQTFNWTQTIKID